MSNLENLLRNFRLSEKSRSDILNGSLNPPAEFEEIAGTVLSGRFEVESEGRTVKVRPTCVEFYYHEEAAGGIKDYIVYHRNHGKNLTDIFHFGSLHNHQSGIDITFEGGESPETAVRASMLIREFAVEGKEGNETRSTKLYDALYQYNVFSGFSVKWVDGERPVENIKPGIRRNVAAFTEPDDRSKAAYKTPAPDSLPADLRTDDRKSVLDQRKWQFRVG